MAPIGDMTMVTRIRGATLVSLLSACAETSEPATDVIAGEVPTGRATGVAHVTVTNAGATPIFVVDECCYAAFLRMRAGDIWTHGGKSCGTPGTHNDPNARIVRIESGASITRDWHGIFYYRSGTGAETCTRSRYAEPGDYAGTVCVFVEEPPSAYDTADRRCGEVTLTLPPSGETTTEVSFD